MAHPTPLPDDHRFDTELGDGTAVRIRLLRADDGPRLQDGLGRLSEESRYRRFMTGVAHLSASEIRELTDVDGIDHVAYGAELIDADGNEGMGLGTARYVRSRHDPTEAEFAVTVIDEYHRRGLASLLLDVLGDHARRNGIERLTAVMLAENRPVQELIRTRGGRLFTTDEPTIMGATIELVGS